MMGMNAQMSDAQLRWACRRGMLELDLILEQYYNQRLKSASLQERKNFEAFLQCYDQDLYHWLVKREKPPQAFQTIVAVLLQLQDSQHEA